MGDIITSLRIDKELWKRARIYAMQNNMTVKKLIEKLIREHLEKVEVEA